MERNPAELLDHREKIQVKIPNFNHCDENNPERRQLCSSDQSSNEERLIPAAWSIWHPLIANIIHLAMILPADRVRGSAAGATKAPFRHN